MVSSREARKNSGIVILAPKAVTKRTMTIEPRRPAKIRLYENCWLFF
jgi:hypothetical protein